MSSSGIAMSHALRRLRLTPAFTGTAIVTLALGMGLASATGVVARAIAFAGLPVRDAERVVVLWGTDRAGSFQHLPLSPNEFRDLAPVMQGVATIAAGDYNGAYPIPFEPTEPGGVPLRLRGTLAGGNYFDVLGANPILGRALRPEDDVIGAPRVMVLSHAAWRRHFDGDPAVIGRAVRSVVWGAPYEIVGVMAPGLDMPRGVEFWTAFAPTAARNGSLDQSPWGVDVVARLEPGATAEQAREALTRFYATLASQGQVHLVGARATVRTLPALVTGDIRPAFTALAAAAAIVLLVTCVNVAGLLLVRAGARRREFAVRTALGAARGRLVRELLSEYGLLAVAGGAAGAVLAVMTVRAFAALAPQELPRVADLGVDWTLFGAVALVTAVVMLVTGLTPAIAGTRVPPAEALGGAREGAGGRVGDARLRRGLVAAQVALALVVLSGASLVGRSLAHLTALDLGVPEPERLSFVELVPSASQTATPLAADSLAARLPRWWGTQEAILERVRGTPGVIAVAPVVQRAFAGAGGWDGRVEAEGAAPGDSAVKPWLNMEITNEDYLRATGVTLVRGRWLAPTDREDAARVIVLSERAAQLVYPGVDPVGRRVKLWADKFATIVGVVADTRFREYMEPRPSMYLPYRQFDGGATFLAIRTAVDPVGVAAQVRRIVAEQAPTMIVQDHGTMHTQMALPLARPRLLAGVLGAYALVVVTLAVAGLYAVVAGSVAGRRREFGVRAALGATPRALASLVLGEGARVAAIGAAVGLMVVLAGGKVVAALLYGVTATDPAMLVLSVGVLLLVCLTAVLLPALRAAAADPARELRAE